MAEQAHILQQLAAFGIPSTRVHFINPALASSELPPPTADPGCKSDCPNLNTIAEQAREIAQLQIKTLRSEVRDLPLTTLVQDLEGAVRHAQSIISIYSEEMDRSKESTDEFVSIIRGICKSFSDFVGVVAHDPRAVALVKEMEKGQRMLNVWVANESQEFVGFIKQRSAPEEDLAAFIAWMDERKATEGQGN